MRSNSIPKKLCPGTQGPLARNVGITSFNYMYLHAGNAYLIQTS